MRLLILCLFFGIICANVEEKLVQMVEELKSEFAELKQNNKKVGRITDLKNEIKKLNASMSDQEERIQANEEDLEALEKTVNTRVIFSAVRKYRNVYPGDDITFDEVISNVGKGMDPYSPGVFTAPVSGTYSFSFSATGKFRKSDSGASLVIQVFRGNSRGDQLELSFEEFEEFDAGIMGEDFEGINQSWMMNLAANQRVHLKMYEYSVGHILINNGKLGYPNQKIFAWFNGQLLNAWEA